MSAVNEDSSGWTQTELALRKLWAELLQEFISDQQTSFFDVGGNSLLLLALQSQIDRTFGLAVTIRDLFRHNILADLAHLLDTRLDRSSAAVSRERVGPEARIIETWDGVASPLQEQIWLANRLPGAEMVYSINFKVNIEGLINIDALIGALQALTLQHSVLRSRYIYVEQALRQQIDVHEVVAIPILDLRSYGELQRASALARCSADLSKRPWILEHEQPIRYILVLKPGDQAELLVSAHHIAFDGASIAIFLFDIHSLYEESSKNGFCEPRSVVQYADYVTDRYGVPNKSSSIALNYWRRQLADLPSNIELPGARPRSSIRGFTGLEISRSIRHEFSEKVQAITRQTGATPFIVLVGVTLAFLYQTTNQSDILVGTAVAGRDDSNFANTIGLFANIVPLRSKIEPSHGFYQLVEVVRDMVADAVDNSAIPFGNVLDGLNIQGDLGRPPLYQVSVSLFDARTLAVKTKATTFSSEIINTDQVLTDLEVKLISTNDGDRLSLSFNAALFEEELVESILDSFMTIFEQALTFPDTAIYKLSLLPPERADWQSTALTSFTSIYPADTTVQDLFQKVASQKQDSIALIDGSRKLTYRELDMYSDAIGHRLTEAELGPESGVAVLLSKSFMFVATLIGILKSGSYYIPLEPTLSKESLKRMLLAVRPACLITDLSLAEIGRDLGLYVLLADEINEVRAPTLLRRPRCSASNAAYAMFTSGSTGAPKAVLVPHRAIIHLLVNSREICFRPNDKVAFTSAISFDVMTFDVFGPLLNGITCIVVPQTMLFNAAILRDYLLQACASVMSLTPTLLKMILSQCPSALAGLRELWVGGEQLTRELVESVVTANPMIKVVNGYGPTEATAYATSWDATAMLSGGESIPIGRPLTNTTAYVLDRQLRQVPPAIEGEIYLGGDGLARGYTGSPILTAERFIANPFFNTGISRENRLYRTGDLARVLPNGTIEYRGRIDRQVKVLGQRLELAEVESLLREHRAVGQCAVIATLHNGDVVLAAFVVPAINEEGLIGSLEEHLSKRLRSALIPAIYLTDSIPLLPSGKLDERSLERKRLSPQKKGERDSGVDYPDYQLGIGDTRVQLRKIWANILGNNSIGVETNFFDAGGDSRKAILLHREIRLHLRREIPMLACFQYPTIARMAAYLQQSPSASKDRERPRG